MLTLAAKHLTSRFTPHLSTHCDELAVERPQTAAESGSGTPNAHVIGQKAPAKAAPAVGRINGRSCQRSGTTCGRNILNWPPAVCWNSTQLLPPLLGPKSYKPRATWQRTEPSPKRPHHGCRGRGEPQGAGARPPLAHFQAVAVELRVVVNSSAHAGGVAWRGVAWRGVAWRGGLSTP